MRETEHEQGRGRGEGGAESEAGSRLWAISTEPDVGLEFTNHEIMTWVDIGRSTDWTTQASLMFGQFISLSLSLCLCIFLYIFFFSASFVCAIRLILILFFYTFFISPSSLLAFLSFWIKPYSFFDSLLGLFFLPLPFFFVWDQVPFFFLLSTVASMNK